MEFSPCLWLNESTVPAMSVSTEERKAVFEKAWQTGGGFRFMFETFGDIATNMEANIEAQNFIKGKIAEIVKRSSHYTRSLCHRICMQNVRCVTVVTTHL
jgi:hypothetical protein